MPLLSRKGHRAVVPDCPARIVGNLPGMAGGVDEDPRVAAPKGLAGLPPDRRSRARASSITVSTSSGERVL